MGLILGSQNLAEKLEPIEIVAKQEAAHGVEELTAGLGRWKQTITMIRKVIGFASGSVLLITRGNLCNLQHLSSMFPRMPQWVQIGLSFFVPFGF